MIDLGLLQFVSEAIAKKPRRWLKPSTLMAVVDQESHGAPFFIDTRPGSQYSLNMKGAQVYRHTDPHDKRKAIIVSTGLKEAQIKQWITIPRKIGDWSVPSGMIGKLAKFRFESGYWEKYRTDIPDDYTRFMYSCSWGLVQFMSPNISKTHDEAGINSIRRFSADIPLQLLYGAGMVEELLERASKPISTEQIERWQKGYAYMHGKEETKVPPLTPEIFQLCTNATQIERAYKGYNSGNIDSHDLSVIKRAQAVKLGAAATETYLQSIKRS